MEITERPLLLDLAPSPARSRQARGASRLNPKRAPGIHWSDIIRRLAAALPQNAGKRKHFDTLTDEEKAEMAARIEVGLCWEQVIEQEEALKREIESAFKHRVQARSMNPSRRLQVRLLVDEIHLTPDVTLDPESDPDGCVVEEDKATWKSQRRSDDFFNEFWDWDKQVQGYAYALVRKGRSAKARFRVLWVNGRYRGWGKGDSEGPCARDYIVTYSARELHETWQMGLGERDRMLKEKANGR